MKRLLFVLIPILFLSGCKYLDPFIQDLNLISIPQEVEISDEMAKTIQQEMVLIEGTANNRNIEQLGARLVEQLPKQEFPYQFYVVKAADPNAFTIPGGKIYVHTGLIDFADSESEIAGVLAHEVAHAYERHPVKGLSRIYGIDLITKLLFKENSGKLKTLTMQIATSGIMSKYGRDDEREADAVGYRILSAAGYPSDGLLRFLQKLSKISSASPLPFLSSHPPTPERIESLKALAKADLRAAG